MLSQSSEARAIIYNNPSVPRGAVLTVEPTDTVNYNYANSGTHQIDGTLNNMGLATTQDIYIPGAFKNYGNLIAHGALSILGGNSSGSNYRIINYQGGNIMLGGYIDVYSNSGLVQNFGRFNVVKGVGYGIDSTEPFTYMFGGLIQNESTGVFLFDRNNGTNICRQTGRVGTFKNLGLVEVASGTVCNFAENPPNTTSRASYVQDGGETRVNGVFGANPVTINAGTLSGNGTIIGLSTTNTTLNENVVISPGSPVGTLTIFNGSSDLICTGCSIDIDIAAASSSDRITSNSDVYLFDWKLNVTLRNGYIPAPGSTFTILSAGSVMDYGPPPTYNLPLLPNGRTWSVENNGTAIILRAN